MSFDWEFEEDQQERVPPPPEAGGPSTAPRRRWLHRGLVLLAVLAAAGLGLRAWYQGRQHIVQQAEAQLRALVELELEAIARGDAELYYARQDPAAAQWRDRQVARYFGAGTGTFAPAPGLVPAARPGRIDGVHLSGQTARVELTRWFTPTSKSVIASPAGTTQPPGAFRLTWFYRQNPDGTWYHVAPPEGYWGPTQVWDEYPLDIQLTQAEARALQRPDPDGGHKSNTGVWLREMVTQACIWMQCPERGRYTLRFDDVLTPHIRDNTWTLPALTLAGLPADAASRTLWKKALEAWLVETLARVQIQDAQLTRRLIYQQLIARLQQELQALPEPAAALSAPERDLVARAVRENQAHSIWELWRVEADPDDPGETRLLRSEIALLLDYLTQQVGTQRVFRLLPALDEYARFGGALSALYTVDEDAFETAWQFHLASLALEPLVLPSANGTPPGDHLALLCDGRIWIGNGDGSQLAPLTPPDTDFDGLHWSPDGRWLLSTWQPRFSNRRWPAIPYLLAADGRGGRILSQQDPVAVQVTFLNWHPDSHQVSYYGWQPSVVEQNNAQFWVVDVETGARTPLPGLPEWSPDGQHLAYISIDTNDPPAVWIAQADWRDTRLVAEQGWFQPGLAWSPDGERLALLDAKQDMDHPTAAVYDVTSGRVTPLLSATELVTAFLAYEGDLISDGSDPNLIRTQPPRDLWPLAWSADGRQLLVFAWSDSAGAASPGILAAIPWQVATGLQRPQPLPLQVVAYGKQTFFGTVAWSPTDPRRLALTGMRPDDQRPLTDNYLFDLDAGVVYSAPHHSPDAFHSLLSLGGAGSPAWSPDGRWVAFVGQDGVAVVDRDGGQRFDFAPGGSDGCHNVSWNPVADLGRLNVSRQAMPSPQRQPGFSRP